MKNPHVDLTILVENLKRYQTGEKEAGLDILKMEEFQRIIGRECSRYIPEHDLDELKQLCYHVILKILQRFKLPEDSKGGHILAYFDKFLGKRLDDAVEKMDKEHMELSFDEPINAEGITLADILPDPSTLDMEDRIALKQDLMAAIKTLTPNQQVLIQMAFFKDMTHEDIASQLGRSRQAVSSSIQEAIKKLQVFLKDYFE